jgi:integrase/recombinase XerD
MSTLTNDKAAFLDHCRIKHYTDNTLKDREEQLDLFIRWCHERDITDTQTVTRPILERYQRHLHHYRKKDGRPLSILTQSMRITAVRVFFKWLAKYHHILYNPASEIELPKLPRHLPRNVLTQREIEQVINLPDTRTVLGIRDRALLEVLYSTGMRRMELINLTLRDLDIERGTVMIRDGKGNKDRVVPIGERAIAWLLKYIEEARDEYALIPDDGYLFRMKNRKPFTTHQVSNVVRQYIKDANLGKTGSCHLIRHTMATLMLENGADIRYIQAILGHEDLATTQVYTQVTITQLKAVHTKTHPARLTRQASSDTEVV